MEFEHALQRADLLHTEMRNHKGDFIRDCLTKVHHPEMIERYMDEAESHLLAIRPHRNRTVREKK